jgi:hypothetical protein
MPGAKVRMRVKALGYVCQTFTTLVSFYAHLQTTSSLALSLSLGFRGQLGIPGTATNSRLQQVQIPLSS